MNYSDLMLVVHPSVPAKTLPELIALAKSRPGKLNFGSGSIFTLPGVLTLGLQHPQALTHTRHREPRAGRELARRTGQRGGHGAERGEMRGSCKKTVNVRPRERCLMARK